MDLIEHLVAVAENFHCDMVCMESLDKSTHAWLMPSGGNWYGDTVIARNAQTDVWELFRRNDAGGYDYVAPACEDDADKVQE